MIVPDSPIGDMCPMECKRCTAAAVAQANRGERGESSLLTVARISIFSSVSTAVP